VKTELGEYAMKPPEATTSAAVSLETAFLLAA
jgi:hypothetical protein